MAENFFYRIGASLFSFGGRDNYTQTNFNNRFHNEMFMKGEQLVDASIGNIENIINTTPQVGAVIGRRGSMLANGRWREYKMGRDGKKILVDNSDLVRILENPNPLQNGNALLESINFAFCGFGNAIVNQNRVGLKPLSMYSLPMSKTTIKRGNTTFKAATIDEMIESVYTEVNGYKEYYDIKDLMFLKMANSSDPLLGVSPIEELKLEISNIRGAKGFRNRIISNNAALGVLSGAVTDGMAIGLDKKERDRLNEGFTRQYGMQNGKADVMMAEKPVQWTPMSYPTKDLMLFEEVDQDFKMVIDYFKLNENMFSFSKSSTFNNLLEGTKSGYQNCIIPFAEEIALMFTKGFGLDGKERWLELDFSHLEILKADEKVKSENIKRNVESAKILKEIGYNTQADLLINSTFES